MDPGYTLMKIIIVGDSGCGKTTLSYRFANDVTPPDANSTIGIEFVCKRFYADGYDLKMHIWDTAGQERFRSITRSYYRGSHGCVLCFRLDKRETFDHLHSYVKDVQNLCDDKTVVFLVGTFADQKREVSQDEIDHFITSNPRICEYFQVNCLRDDLQTIFRRLGIRIVEIYDMNYLKFSSDPDVVKFYDKDNEKEGCKC